jgi:Tol biopolymer transport system component
VIRVYAADGSLRQAISGLGDVIGDVSWSPAGGRIAFTSFEQFPHLTSRSGTPILGSVYVVTATGRTCAG